MKAWIFKERGVVVKTDSLKAKKIFAIMIISNHELAKKSEQDARWVSCDRSGECLHFLLTNIDSSP